MTCAMCGEPLPLVAQEYRDPYCTSTCARLAFDNPLPDKSIWSRDEHVRRTAASS